MKKKEFVTYRGKPLAELQTALHERKVRLADLQEDLISGKIKSLKEMHIVQKDIAQLLTVLQEMSHI